MKRGAIIIAAVLLVSLAGCQWNKTKDTVSPAPDTNISVKETGGTTETSGKKAESPVQIDINNASQQINSYVEDGGFIYYPNDKGINKLDKKTGKAELIYQQQNAGGLSLTDKNIYFLSGSDLKICQIDKDGQNYGVTFDGKQVKDEYDANMILKYTIVDSKVFVQFNLDALYSYDMASKEVKKVLTDVESFKVKDGYIYSTDHAERTLSIYKTNIDTLKKERILGEGVYKPAKNLYYEFVFVGDTLYTTTGLPYGLSSYSNGTASVLVDTNGKRPLNLTKYQDNIYYAVLSTDKDYKLMKYDIKSKKVSEAAELKDFKLYLSIVNGYAYYSTSDGVKSVRLTE